MRLLLLFAVFVGNGMFAQNLVPNSDFEYFTSCPSASSQISKAYPWIGPLNNNSDYFNSCSNIVNVPQAGNGFQYANSGQGFAGFYTLNGYGTNYREYIQTEITNTLSQNIYYKVSFYCSSMGIITYTTNNVGLNFSSYAVNNTGTGSYLNLTTHILKFGNPIIKDSMNWVKIEGIYYANGTEKYLTIGNFKSDQNTDTLNMENSNYPGAYYYVDDVSVEEITVPFWSYSDTLVNYGDSVLIGPALTGLDIDWYTDNMEFISNGPGIYVSPATSRNYIAKETFNGVETEHNVYVTVIGGVGLAENALQKIEVYPNPSKGDFSISGIKNESPLQLEVRDVHGKLVFESQNLSKEVNGFNLNVEDGIYFVNVTNPSTREVLVKKLVVRK